MVEKIDFSEELPLPPDESELVYWGSGVERLSYQDGLRMLKECWRILRPGGTGFGEQWNR